MASEKLEALLDSDLGMKILAGVTFAGGIVFTILAIAAGICALALPPWWVGVVCFILCGLLSGFSFGLGIFFSEQSW